MKSARSLWVIGGALSMLINVGVVSAGQDAASFLADVQAKYAERPSYADIGEIEITEEIDGIEGSEVHFFETSATRGAGLVWRLMLVTDRGLEDRAVWLTGDSVMIYDGSLRQTQPAPSVASAVEELLGRAAGQALLVPMLLEFDTGSKALEALASNSVLTPAEPCLNGRRCRLLEAPMPDGGRVSLRVDADTLWVHDVEVIARRGPDTVTVRVRQSESSLEDDDLGTRASFSPSPATREVQAWETTEDPSFDPRDLAGEFSEFITVDLFSVTARIVDDFGAPVPDLGPNDLIATVRGRELPIVAVDWEGASPSSEDTDERETPEDAFELPRLVDPAAIEKPERLVVIFLQNDFEPTRVKGQMKLFPALRQLIDNLGAHDRVAVLSFFAHLKLWQDFTTDKDQVKSSLNRAFFPGAKPPPATPDGHPSLLDTFDEAAARAIPNAVEALHYTADALATIPGEKDIIYFGFGFERRNLREMLRALQAARATALVIDTTQADFHTLGASLETMAAATGGVYKSSLFFARQAVHEIERLLSGRYRITVDRSAASEARGRLEIRLRDRRGTVLMTPSGFN